MHEQVDGWIRDGIAAGALGGKLVGAGGGGFLLFYAEEKAGLREAWRTHGLEEVRFGSTTRARRSSSPSDAARWSCSPAVSAPGSPRHRGRTPKALVEVAGRPFIDWKLEELAARRDPTCSCSSGTAAMRSSTTWATGARSACGARSWPTARGCSAPAGRSAGRLPALPDAFWVTYGDSLLEVDVPRAEAEFARRPRARPDDRSSQADGRTRAMHVEGGLVVGTGRTQPPVGGDHIDYGMLLFDAEAFESFTDSRAFDLVQVLNPLIATRRLVAFAVTEAFHDIGTPGTLRETERFIRARRGG